MPQKSSLLPAPMAPFLISRKDRAYYQNVWGFDPVTDWVKPYDRDDVVFYLEAWFPLAADPGLAAAGVEIGAQVTVNTLLGNIMNDLVFRAPGELGPCYPKRVECIHTVVYTGSLDDALNFSDANAPPEHRRPRSRRARERRQLVIAAKLPPWEHFAALKSYVAAVAEAGIGNLLRASRAKDPDAPEMRAFGFNGRMQAEIISAIGLVSLDAGRALLRDYLLELLDTAPRDWFLSRLEYFEDKFSHEKELFDKIRLVLK